jgi:DNA-directed RNA polymerase subunit RPC12/RpoP
VEGRGRLFEPSVWCPGPPSRKESVATVGAGVSVFEAGDVAGAGSYVCVECGFGISLEALDTVPSCPTCSGARFRRASMFEQPTVDEGAIEVESDPDDPEWLRELRDDSKLEGQFLCFDDDDGVSVVPIPEGWTRIGRSGMSDLRLDDPTVSRRHALIVKTDSGELRVLDDRSLNGVFVNGARVEWSPVVDGDELAIGRYRLHIIDTVETPLPDSAARTQA